MNFSLAPQLIIFFFMVLGALHVLGPDHWLPASVLAWQKKWKFSKTILFSIVAFFSHVLTGYLLFLVFQKWVHASAPAQLFLFAPILMF